MILCRVFEPEAPINTPEDFEKAIQAFAKEEHKDIKVLEATMTPRIEMDGRDYVCRLQDADLSVTENPFQRAFGMMDNTPGRKVVGIYRPKDGVDGFAED